MENYSHNLNDQDLQNLILLAQNLKDEKMLNFISSSKLIQGNYEGQGDWFLKNERGELFFFTFDNGLPENIAESIIFYREHRV